MIDEDVREPRGRQRSDYVSLLIGPIFIVLAAWFLFGPAVTDIPDPGMTLVAREEITTEPMRTMMSDPPTTLMGGYDLRCQECHKLFESPPETVPANQRRLTQHQEIVLDHGLNDRCFNCHDRENRNLLALPGEGAIPYKESPRLCASCHGTTYRDWQVGVHGRTNGSWNAELGTQNRLQCTQCHDPHKPAFPPMHALPGPNTLRMGDPHASKHSPEEEAYNPLRTWTHGEGHVDTHAEDADDHESDDHDEGEAH